MIDLKFLTDKSCEIAHENARHNKFWRYEIFPLVLVYWFGAGGDSLEDDYSTKRFCLILIVVVSWQQYSHFKKYVNLNNMFALPKEIGELGELKDFIEEQK